MDNFVHLHVHTKYSVLDGLSEPKALAQRAKDLGMSAIAFTDHNHLAGLPDFYKSCKEVGIKPLYGCEMYYTEDTKILSINDSKKRDAQYRKRFEGLLSDVDLKKITYDNKELGGHILFIAKNQIGLRNLIKLQSEASQVCTYNKRYWCDLPMIERYSEGLICTTACIGSVWSKMISDGRTEEFEQLTLKFKEIFEDDFYLEIQQLTDTKQLNANKYYIDFGAKHDIKLVATNDVHFCNKEDYDIHDTLVCIGLGCKKGENKLPYPRSLYLQSYDEMIEGFKKQSTFIGIENYMSYVKEALKNTLEIANKVEDDLKIGSDIPLFTDFKVPEGYTPESYLEEKCNIGLEEYLKKKPYLNKEEYKKRLDYELCIINKKGYAVYFLTVHEYVEWCRHNNIAVGPGRGSAAGSLALYMLGVTKGIDPIEYKLLFSRFLTEDRTSPPDKIIA